MKKLVAPACVAIACAASVHGQGRPVDWSFYGGDAQRTGWEKADTRITRDNVKDFQLVLKQKLDNGPGGTRALTPPVIIGNLISYRGFKELGFVAGSSGKLWSIDVDMDRIFWQKQLSPPSQQCAGVVAGTPSLTPPLNFGARPRPTSAGPTRSPGAPPSPAGAPAGAPAASAARGGAPAASAARGILGAGGFGSPRPAFALSNDGKLHLLNTSNGDDLVPPIPFIPANAKASSLAISNNVIYTTTDGSCAGTPAGVWALDLSTVDPKDSSRAAPRAVSFLTKGEPISALGGAAFGTDGTVYIQTSRTLYALHPKDLTEKGHFTAPASSPNLNPAAPVIFTHKSRDFIGAAGGDGKLYLLDSQSLDTPVSQVSISGIWGGLSSFLDPSGTPWILAPVSGTQHDSITAFKVEEQNGKPALTRAWVSRDMSSPAPPVITSGIIFALSTGGHAVLYALDALTGQEIYSTGNQVTAPGELTGLTLANGRVFFTTTDNTLYAFGIYLER